jgi:sugar phosphate isomerase/epimerase
MTTRREFIHSTLAGLIAASAPSAMAAAQMSGAGPKTAALGAPIGLQLYSLRHLFKKGDVAGTLALVKQWGITHVELAGTYGMTSADFAALLKKTGLHAVSTHADFNKLATEPAAAFDDAKTFGVEYAGCAWIPHNEKEKFGAADAEKAVKVFNAAGAKAKEAGLRFFYHIHGYEFQPAPGGGTFFDTIAKGTDPSLVAFEMDVFWAVRGGANPVALFTTHPGRFELTHLKDMQKGLSVGDPTGHAPDTSNVPLGTGQIDWTSVLREANRQKVKYHFIEDEHPQSEKQIPQSLQYLATLKL